MSDDSLDQLSPDDGHGRFLDLTDGAGNAFAYYDDEDDDGEGEPGSPEQIGRTAVGTNVVETGLEHTGRWTREEHDAFLSGLKQYGKEWKKVAAKVKTRTVVQTRTHAQKYFQKLQKAVSDKGGGDAGVLVDIESLTESKKVRRKKPSTTKQRSQSTTAAAQLMANLSSSIPGISTQTSNAYPTPHGFSQSSLAAAATAADSLLGSYTAPFPFRPVMTIVAPNPETSMRRGFPEPSPAACGKRKLAELAAAQMLAGVANSSSVTAVGADGAATPPPMDYAPQEMNFRPMMNLQIVNPETLGITFQQRRTRADISPTTPWDGQLEALVSEHKREMDATMMPPAPNIFIDTCLKAPDLNGHAVDEESPPHPVCGPGNSYNRSCLHKAVCEVDLGAVQRELSDSIRASALHRRDDAGFLPIHSACALCMVDSNNAAASTKITHFLISVGGDCSALDGNRNTPLHWAARAGNDEVAQLLMMRNCPPNAQNDDGDTALHWAMRAGRKGMTVVKVLLENGARASLFNNEFRRPLDSGCEPFIDVKKADGDPKKIKKVKPDSKKRKTELLQEIREVRGNLLVLSAQSRTLVLHHQECLEHIPKSEMDWEVPDRVNAIMNRLIPKIGSSETTGVFPHEVSISSDFARAKIDLLSRVHSAEYLSFVNDLSKELTRRKDENNGLDDSTASAPVVPFTPMVQKTMMKTDAGGIKKESHSDTSFSAGSLRAARRAAGAVQHAVDCVLVGRHRNAFCVVRPPGHHAGIKGLLAGGESCGFCIFNNVAAGALHAISDERLMCQRCAIVDIDVHHGNGTEEIVKHFHDPGKLFFFSIHLYDTDKRKAGYSFYPGTGDEDCLAHNIINVPIAPLWREAAQPAPVSGNTVQPNTHNTRNKAKNKSASTASSTASTPREGSLDGDESPDGIACLPLDPMLESDTASDSASARESSSIRSQTTRPSSPRYNSAGRYAYRKAVQNRLLPALRAFNPDLILISAGFDAAKGDVGNARHFAGGKEKMGLDLEPEDYAWTTRKIMEIADICCQGRVVSVLEGGYGRSPIQTANVNQLQSLDKAFFSECAIRHLHGMIDPYDLESRFPC